MTMNLFHILFLSIWRKTKSDFLHKRVQAASSMRKQIKWNIDDWIRIWMFWIETHVCMCSQYSVPQHSSECSALANESVHTNIRICLYWKLAWLLYCQCLNNLGCAQALVIHLTIYVDLTMQIQLVLYNFVFWK